MTCRTCNDLEASLAIRKIHRAADLLNSLMREGKLDELELVAAEIRRAGTDLETRAGLLAERAV